MKIVLYRNGMVQVYCPKCNSVETLSRENDRSAMTTEEVVLRFSSDVDNNYKKLRDLLRGCFDALLLDFNERAEFDEKHRSEIEKLLWEGE
jgi:hypothetical protein